MISKVAPTISAEPIQLAVLLSGRGSNLQAILNAVGSGMINAKISIVLSDRPEAAGLDLARANGVHTEVLEKERGTNAEQFSLQLVDRLQQFEPDVIVLAGFMRILGPSFISAFENRILNIHPSLLPAFRGARAQQQAISAGVKFTGCTVHLVTEEVDAGKILAQAVVPVLADDSVETLSIRILAREHEIYPATIGQFVQLLSGQGDSASLEAMIEQRWPNTPRHQGL